MSARAAARAHAAPAAEVTRWRLRPRPGRSPAIGHRRRGADQNALPARGLDPATSDDPRPRPTPLLDSAQGPAGVAVVCGPPPEDRARFRVRPHWSESWAARRAPARRPLRKMAKGSLRPRVRGQPSPAPADDDQARSARAANPSPAGEPEAGLIPGPRPPGMRPASSLARVGEQRLDRLVEPSSPVSAGRPASPPVHRPQMPRAPPAPRLPSGGPPRRGRVLSPRPAGSPRPAWPARWSRSPCASTRASCAPAPAPSCRAAAAAAAARTAPRR